MIVRDTYPIPCMDESIDTLQDTKVFSILDANSEKGEMLIAQGTEARQGSRRTSEHTRLRVRH